MIRTKLTSLSTLVLLCAVASPAFAQDARLEGVQYKRDGQDRVVALDYWVSSGLRRVVPKDISQLESVYIVYGTKLSADDMSVLSTMENVEYLTLGGVMSAEQIDRKVRSTSWNEIP